MDRFALLRKCPHCLHFIIAPAKAGVIWIPAHLSCSFSFLPVWSGRMLQYFCFHHARGYSMISSHSCTEWQSRCHPTFSPRMGLEEQPGRSHPWGPPQQQRHSSPWPPTKQPTTGRMMLLTINPTVILYVVLLLHAQGYLKFFWFQLWLLSPPRDVFFLLLGNLFSWFGLKQQQTVVDSPACFKCAFLLDSLRLADVHLLCCPSTRDGQRLSPRALQAARIRNALPETPSCEILRNSSTSTARRTLQDWDRCRHPETWHGHQQARGIQVKWTCIIVPFKKRIMPLSSYEVILSSLEEIWNVSV